MFAVTADQVKCVCRILCVEKIPKLFAFAESGSLVVGEFVDCRFDYGFLGIVFSVYTENPYPLEIKSELAAFELGQLTCRQLCHTVACERECRCVGG